MTRPTRIMLVATSYPRDLGDWRGLFIRHMADALGRRGELDVGLWAPPGERPDAVRDLTSDADRAWLERLMAAGGIAHLWRRAPVRGPLGALSLMRRLHRAYRRHDADLRHVNWLQNALPLPADGRPLLVTALGTDMKLLGLPLVRRRLRHVFAQRATAIRPNAEWMVAPLLEAFGDVADVRFLSFGIDPAWFGTAVRLRRRHAGWRSPASRATSWVRSWNVAPAGSPAANANCTCSARCRSRSSA
jgi:hypothetical protein